MAQGCGDEREGYMAPIFLLLRPSPPHLRKESPDLPAPPCLFSPLQPWGPWHAASQLAPIVITPQGVMGTHSPCPLQPPLPRQGQALTMPPQPASGLDTMPLIRFIASSRRPAGFPGLFGIYITLASSRDFFFFLTTTTKKSLAPPF